MNDDPKAERKNESKYRSIFSEIIKRNAGLVKSNDKNCHNPEHYAAETSLIRNTLAAERNAVLCGIGIGILAFASFRYLPSYIIRRLGTEEKRKALREAQEAEGTMIRNNVALLFEGAFGIWAGMRGYRLAREGREDTYEEISKIPLLEGRSAISDGLCREWVDAAYRQIPSVFWVNLQNDKLRDPHSWRAIGKFAQNCVKRDLYEKKLREEIGLSLDEPVVIPSPGVPDNLLSADQMLLPRETADKLVTDNDSDEQVMR